MLRRADGIDDAPPDKIAPEEWERIPSIPIMLRVQLQASAEVSEHRYRKAALALVTETEQPCRGRPSEVEANTSSICHFPGHYLTCLSLQNYCTSSPHPLLSSSSSSFSSHSALIRSLCGRPAFVFCDCKSFLLSSFHHCPQSCSRPS